RDFHVTGVQTCALPIFTDTYTAAIVDNWVAHQVTVSGLDVRVAENGLAGVALRRNGRPIGGQTPRDLFVYSTPEVRFPQPNTPRTEERRVGKERRPDVL